MTRTVVAWLQYSNGKIFGLADICNCAATVAESGLFEMVRNVERERER